MSGSLTPAILPFLIAIVLAISAVGAQADVRVDNDRLTITTANLSAQFRGPDLVGLTNRLTGERYIATQTPLRAMIDMGMLKPTGRPLKWTEWRRGKPPGGNLDAAMMSMTDLTRTVWFTVVVDQRTEDIAITLWGDSQAAGVTGLTWGLRGLDLSAGRLILPAQGGRSADASSLPSTLELEYPTHWEAQMLVWEGKRGGFVLYSRDEGALFKRLHVRRRGGYADVGLETQAEAPFTRANGVPQVEWRINAFRGDWRVPATGYRQLMQHFRPKPPLTSARKWVRDIRAVVTVHGRADDPKLLDALAGRLTPARTMVYLPDWRVDGYDVNYPDYTPRDKARSFVEHARRLGFRVMLHVDLPGVSPGHPDYARMKRYQVKDPVTLAPQGWYWDRPATLPHRFAYINPAARAYRDLFIARLRPLVEAVHPDALHLDVSGPMFNDGNGLIDGKSYTQGSVELHKALLRAFPSVAFGGESMNELISPYNAFAQRWNYGSLPPHPVCEFLFGDVVTSYGYLGLPNPDQSPGEFLSYFTLYEGQGVIPTVPVSAPADVGPERQGTDRALRLARAWQEHDLRPDFERAWEGARFRWRGAGGAEGIVDASGPTVGLRLGGDTLYTRVRGVTRLVTRSHIPGWRAYDDEALLGLDPQADYWLEPVGRPADEPHLSSMGAGVRVVGSHVSTGFAVFRLAPADTTAMTLLPAVGVARTGITVAGREEPLAKGATAHQVDGLCGGVTRAVLLAHPPWRDGAAGSTFVEFDVDVPPGECSFVAELGISDTGAESDGVTFSVTVDGDRVAEQHVLPGGWHPLRVPLSRYRGRTVRLRLVTGPGPANNVSFDQAMWAAPRIVISGAGGPANVTLTVPGGITPILAAGQGAGASAAAGKADFGAVAAPATLVALLEPGAPVQPGSSLLNVSHEVALVSAGVARPGTVFGAGSIGPSTASGSERARTLNAHPPSNGETVVSWVLRLPDDTPLALVLSAGMRDNTQTTGVAYSVRIDGQPVWRHRTASAGWADAAIDLTAYRGRSVLVQLVTDSEGENNFDWAFWDAPRLEARPAAP